MPKVERYSTPKVETQVISGAQATPLPSASFGGDLAQGLSKAAEGVSALQTRIDTASAEEALTKFEREKNKLFFDPDTGYFNTQGKTAYDQAGSITESLTKLKKSYSDSLTSPAARTAFDRVAERHVTSAQQDVYNHASKNIKAWEVETIKSQVENTLENASLYWNDPQRLGVQRELGRQSIMDAATLEGVSPETVNERLQTFESAFARSAVEAATVKSSLSGKEVFEKYKDRLEGTDLVKLQESIKRKEESEKTQADANISILAAGNMVTAYGDQPNARSLILENVNSIADPELRKKTLQEAMFQLDAKLKADSERRAAVFEAGENHLISGGSPESFKASNPEAWEDLTPKQKKTLSSGKAVSTDYVALSNLLTLPKDQLIKVNPTDYYDKLAPEDRNKLITAVKSAREGNFEQVGRSRAKETVSAIEQVLGPTSQQNEKKRTQANQFHSLINEELKFREKAKGAPLTSSEYTALLNDMTKKIVKNRTLWFDKKIDITDIPEENLNVLSDYLHKNNIPATAENLLKAYEQATK